MTLEDRFAALCEAIEFEPDCKSRTEKRFDKLAVVAHILRGEGLGNEEVGKMLHRHRGTIINAVNQYDNLRSYSRWFKMIADLIEEEWEKLK